MSARLCLVSPESPEHFIPLSTHPFLILYDVVTAKLFGQVWSQDVEATPELGEHHVVWITCDLKRKKKKKRMFHLAKEYKYIDVN